MSIFLAYLNTEYGVPLDSTEGAEDNSVQLDVVRAFAEDTQLPYPSDVVFREYIEKNSGFYRKIMKNIRTDPNSRLADLCDCEWKEKYPSCRTSDDLHHLVGQIILNRVYELKKSA